MNSLLKVSIIIPTYGRPDTLSVAVDSCLNQTYSPIEIIVVDDNNPDTESRHLTEQIMERYRDDDRVKYIRHICNKNGSAARNTGFRNSTGDYIAFLDDDDYFYPAKIENQVKRLNELSEDYGVCYSKYETRYNGKVILTYRGHEEGEQLLYALMRNLFIAAGSNLLVKRHIIEEINGFDESFKRNQDLEFLIRILQKYKLAYDNHLGLVVNAATTPRNTNYLEITEQFRKNFNPFISKLAVDEINKVNCVLDLQIFRYYLFSKKDLKSAIKHVKENNISQLTVFRYLVHLLKRFIRKSSESFHI